MISRSSSAEIGARDPLSSSQLATNGAVTPPSSTTGGMRIRKGTAVATTASLTLRPEALASSSSSNIAGLVAIGPGGGGGGASGIAIGMGGELIDGDVTRPMLKKITKDAISGLGGDLFERTSSGRSSPAKGGVKTRSSLDESPRTNGNGNGVMGNGKGKGKELEREVVVHELVKTDSLASISLKYGITPQSVRLANRLWPSDSIHLRKTLLIPLDQCHLPSSSTIERISREPDGNLVVWERDPTARRAASAYEDPSSAASSTFDLLGLDLDQSTGRSSLDSFREKRVTLKDSTTLSGESDPSGANKGKGRATSPFAIQDGDLVSEYLPSTNNPYSFSSVPHSPPNLTPFSTTPFRPSPLVDFHSSSSLSLGLEPDDVLSPPRLHSGSSSSTAPSPSPPPSSTLSRRILTVSKIPINEMSFFPPANPAFSTSVIGLSGSTTPTRLLDESDAGVGGEQFVNLLDSALSLKDDSRIGMGAPPPRIKLAPPTPAYPRSTLPASKPKVKANAPPRSNRLSSWLEKWDWTSYGGEEEEMAGMSMGLKSVAPGSYRHPQEQERRVRRRGSGDSAKTLKAGGPQLEEGQAAERRGSTG